MQHPPPPPAGLPPKPVPAAAGLRVQATWTAPPPHPLDHQQTSSPTREFAARYEDFDRNPDSIPFEHRGWHATRVKILRAMEATEVSEGRRQKFCTCGDEVHVFQEPTTGEVQWRGQRCNDRFCMHCGQIRSYRISRALDPLIRREAAMFLTFTVRGKPGDSLSSLIDTLREAWKGLRRLPYWKERITGGAIMLEIKWSKTSGGHWHPHYHVIAHGKWIDQAWLRQAWSVLTRGSHQVDVQRVVEVEKALSYVVKYASKPMDASFTNRPHLLREAMQTLKGQRLCACFGTWFGTPLHDEEHEDDPTEVLTSWMYCGTVRDLECRAARGDGEAIHLLAAVVRARALRYALTERCRGPDENRAAPPPPTAPLA